VIRPVAIPLPGKVKQIAAGMESSFALRRRERQLFEMTRWNFVAQ
jgi:hypothetical protein